MPKQRRGTKTSSFGSPSRVNHDSSAFYASKLYEGLVEEETQPYLENIMPAEALDKIFLSSSASMVELPDACVHLMATSPPYNVGKEYDDDLSMDHYLAFLKRTWSEVKRVLVPGGRACINIANLGRKPYLPLHAFIIRDMLELGFWMRGEIIWDKASSASASTAWGSWRSPANPTLRDVHEYILVFSKGQARRQNLAKGSSTITRDEFLEYTKSVWKFPAVSARKIGHPAPFPLELPLRLIQLYTYAGDVVLDPFMGSGQTAIAALKTGRHYIGYEIDGTYFQLAEKRIQEAQVQKEEPR
jgi:DNA modification methylase